MPEIAAYPFILASARDVRIAQGLRRVVTATRVADLPDRVRHLLTQTLPGSDAPEVVVGALPFRANHPARLYQPEQWTRPLPSSIPGSRLWPARPPRAPARWTINAVPSREGYERAVTAALGHMNHSGPDALRKVVLARTLEVRADVDIDAAEVFSRLCADKAVTAFAVPLPPCVDGGRRLLIGATPELLAARHGRSVSSRPLAGSARRQADAGDDRRAAEGLARSSKDLREHAAVVEWIADRLAPLCRALSVPKSPSLVSTASMWHLGSMIEGTLRDPELSALDVALALHPTPAICGTPLARALDVIAELEPFERGYYSGAVGWTDAAGDGEWYVSIRCAEVCGPSARLFAGAGIVRGSDPESEAAETAAKFMALRTALGVDAHAFETPEPVR
jgi:isochorismate synthase